MPEKIDRIGRANEWATRYFLLRTEKSLSDMKLYLDMLPKEEAERVLISGEKTAKKILDLNGKKGIKDAIVVGEENKAPGSKDFDIMITFNDESRKGYSLKIQKNNIGVNVRNPTINSLCNKFAKRDFDEFLNEEEKQKYKKLGQDYSAGKINSKDVGTWGANKLCEILKEGHKLNPQLFVTNMLEEIRHETNLILSVVDGSGRFIGYSTKFMSIFDLLFDNPKKIKIFQRGISVFLEFEEKILLHIDVYMMSDSFGKGNKLRAAIRVDFLLD